MRRLLGRVLCARLALSLALIAPIAACHADEVASDRPPVDLALDNAVIHVDFRGPEAAIGRDGLLTWVRRSEGIVHDYYGLFPVRELALRISTVDGSSVRNARTFGTPRGGSIHISVGHDVTADALLHDWVLVHEMIHLALPDVGEEHNWLSEGLATYVEGIARVQAGNMTDVELWAEYVKQMPKGLPAEGDEGLDRTHTWARTYWGGALFCMLADVGIHERSRGRAGLQTALRAIARESGGMTVDWPIDRVLSIGDRATGTTVLQDLYASMKDKAVTTDLGHLWQELGIEPDGDTVRFLDTAPLAAARRDITRTRRTAEH